MHKITTLEAGNDRELKLAKSLALGYQSRQLLKCVFEKIVQRRDKFLASIFNQKSFRDQLSAQIAEKAKVDQSEVYVDVPTAPSVPISSTRESLMGITVVSKRENESRSYELGLDQMPLISTIAGFMDVIRVYTTARYKSRVQKAVDLIFESEGYETKVSM